ncbi:hypothetical protein ACFP63_10555 [Oerskovia jenensis]|uniref:Uncharacterized protein n=1 Tax=Oerskovia jenensis TaxID=162169 RepID=A0ABS2LJI2_9CELL|nr:hypothetical protein [Oerskovia jenensis]MBM7480502.1 hypothetical protein [Oerskovia jenensis]
MRRALRTSLLTAALVLVAAGCSGKEADAPRPQGAADLSEAIIDTAGAGGPLVLADATDFTWDEVALFHQGTTVEEIERVVGDTGLDGKRFTDPTDLFVFRDGGQVVRLLVTHPDVFTGDYGVLVDESAVVEQDPSRPGYVRLAG